MNRTHSLQPHTATTASETARIGPNALIQTVAALREQYDDAAIRPILSACSLTYLLDESPASMVAEADFAALVRVMSEALGSATTHAILRRSGQLTGDYLLTHRIPRPFQRLLGVLNRRLALKLFALAIGQHAWTFAGSGRFAYSTGSPAYLAVTTHIQPGAAVSGFFGGTFEHLVRTLIDANARIDIAAGPRDDTTHRDDTTCYAIIHFAQHRTRGGVSRSQSDNV